jgi:hypothetical protein
VRQVGAALQHLRRRRPIRPFLLGCDLFLAGPGEAGLADADAVADGGAVVLHEEQEALRRIDDDGAGRFGAVIADDLLEEFRIDRARVDGGHLLDGLAARIEVGGRTRRRHGAAAAEQELDEAAAEIGVGVGRSVLRLRAFGRSRSLVGLRRDIGRG